MAGNATELLVQRMRRARRITVPLSPTPQAPADAAPKRIFRNRPTSTIIA